MRPHLIRLSVFGFCSVAGLLSYMLLAGITGWERPLWLLGDAMISLVYGFATLGIGAIPFYLVAVAILRLSRTMMTLRNIGASGLILGVVFQPVMPIVGSFIKDLSFWSSLENASQVGIGLGVVGLLCTIVAAAIVVAYSILTTSRFFPSSEVGPTQRIDAKK